MCVRVRVCFCLVLLVAFVCFSLVQLVSVCFSLVLLVAFATAIYYAEHDVQPEVGTLCVCL